MRLTLILLVCLTLMLGCGRKNSTSVTPTDPAALKVPLPPEVEFDPTTAMKVKTNNKKK